MWIVAFAAISLVMCAMPVHAAVPTQTLIILPLENLSANVNATAMMMPLLQKAAARHGWKVAPGESLEPLLEEHRVRYLDSLDADVREKLLSKVGATAYLSGTIYEARDGDAPLVACSVRMMSIDGRVLWGDIIGMTAGDTEGLLGMARARSIAALASKVVSTLMKGMPRPGDAPRKARGPSKPLWKSGPQTFRSALLEQGKPRRVAIIPFDSASPERIAPRVVADVLLIRLAAFGEFEVVEPALVRAAARQAGVHSFSFISTSQLAKIGEVLGTSLFLRGSVYTWRGAPPRSSQVPPELQVELSLVDVDTGRILWGSNHLRKGDEYEGLLLLGAVSNPVTLTDRVFSEMIRAEAHAKPLGKAIAAKNEAEATKRKKAETSVSKGVKP